jgi:hypothetical protein
MELTQMLESKVQVLDKRLAKLKDETLPKRLRALGETVDDKIKVISAQIKQELKKKSEKDQKALAQDHKS